MTPAATPPDSRVPRWLLACVSIAVLFATVLAITFSAGCSSAPPPVDETNTTQKVDAWKAAGSRLKKETDFGATKSALASLTSEVSQQDGDKLPALSDDALAALGKIVPLSAGDVEEIRGSAFSSHDAIYLADCFYLRDAARSLALTGLPADKQAELAFAWVCRQVYLQPWPRNVGTHFEPTVLPATAVLRRGFGAGIERMYVFLALLQQLELDACLIGPPDAATQQSRQGTQITYPYVAQLHVPRGPFWAVGVRVGNDVRLFDPWRGEAFTIALNELKKNPQAAKAWFEDKANISGATLEDAKNATVFLAVPVNSLSPRMAMFEAKLKSELGVKLAFDQKALEAKRAALGEAKFWNPPEDPFAFGRAARSFWPLEMGGGDRSPQSAMRIYESYIREQIPPSAIRAPDNLVDGAAVDRIRAMAGGALYGSFIESPNPRERIQRGQFQDAAKDVVAKQDFFASGLERLRTENAAQQAAQIKEWIEATNKLYAELGSASFAMNDAKMGKGDPDAAAMRMAAVTTEIDRHWRQQSAQLIVDQLSAEVGRAEAALLLALCKHEQAERIQIRLERATGADAERLKTDALDAWKTALGTWRTYEQSSSAHTGFPGRAAHAKMLSNRAAKFAEGKK